MVSIRNLTLRTRILNVPRLYLNRCAVINANQRASFHSSGVRAVGKETSLHEEGRDEKVDKIKQQHLQDQKEGKGKWTEELASNSEEAVKADRGEISATDDDIKKLQEETTQHLKNNNPPQ